MATLIFLILCTTTTTLLRTTNGAPVDDVCKQTKNPPLCLSVLTIDPRSKTAALPQLAQFSIDTAEAEAVHTKTKIHKLLLSAKDPKLRDAYGRVEGFWSDALDALTFATEQLAANRYPDVAASGLRIRASVDKAAGVLGKAFPFKKEREAVGIVGDAISVIARKL